MFSLSFRSFGVTILIESNADNGLSAVRQVVKEAFPRCHRFVSHRQAEHHFRLVWKENGIDLLYRDSATRPLRRKRQTLLEILRSRLRLTVAEFATDFAFFHAGVVALDGKAIVIPGKSMDGKTTLVVELIKRGATYYSDEYAVLDKDGMVHPFPKSLSIREGSNGDQTEYSANVFKAKTGTKPVPVSLVVSTKYQSRGIWRPKTLSDTQGALELIRNSVSARRNPAMVLTVLKKVSDRAKFLKTPRGEADISASKVLQIVRRDSVQTTASTTD
jgi:hypothetical protein